MDLKKLICSELRNILTRIESDTCEIDKSTAMQILSVISHEPLSKAESYQELQISRSKFDTLVRNGDLPPGKKRIGFNELAWYKDEIITKYNSLKNGK